MKGYHWSHLPLPPREEPPTHIDGPPLCQCGKPLKCYRHYCEDCWIEENRDRLPNRPAGASRGYEHSFSFLA